jgi:hypothetical protein
MTRAKSLLLNVTLLVRPGLEPKIDRLGGPHGVSCGRGLNPRHGPPQTFAKQLGNENCTCNNGWLDSFKNRHNIVYTKVNG